MRTATQQATWLPDHFESARRSNPAETSEARATRSAAGFFGVFALLALASLFQMALYPELVAEILGR